MPKYAPYGSDINCRTQHLFASLSGSEAFTVTTCTHIWNKYNLSSYARPVTCTASPPAFYGHPWPVGRQCVWLRHPSMAKFISANAAAARVARWVPPIGQSEWAEVWVLAHQCVKRSFVGAKHARPATGRGTLVGNRRALGPTAC